MPTAEDALRICQAYGRSGAFSISQSAHARVRAEGLSPADVEHALANAARCAPADGGEGRWAIRGPSLDGTEIDLLVVLAADALSVV
jgi:hypothetical protein